MSTLIGMGKSPQKKDDSNKQVIRELRAHFKSVSDELEIKTEGITNLTKANENILLENEKLQKEIDTLKAEKDQK